MAFKTELVAEDILTGGLYESTIYLLIICVGIYKSRLMLFDWVIVNLATNGVFNKQEAYP